ncbi:aminotransferase class V-fold PLP-dependent enzyme, partial [Candidatus Woesearchaeota archaeon]|nr:aminotransferase class V-fold PLP-dependent enzyme [Candidatus Woesearchaeota archaeon]
MSEENSEATKILEKIKTLVEEHHEATKKPLVYVPVSGKIFDAEELKNLVEASLEGWWTEGKWSAAFEKGIAEYIGIKYALSVNSGSSANLVALATLCSPKLGEKRLKAGDEVITVAAGFPTTISPIIQLGFIPVFIDVDLGTYNVNIDSLKKAIGPKTRAIMLAHTLGNPFNIDEIMALCKEHNLWLIEDACDAIGSTYDGKKVGTFGHLSTASFYPAHHITTAEGGALFTNDPQLFK